MTLLKLLKNPSYIFLFIGTSAIFFAFNAYLLIALPGSNGYACIPGANINLLNIVFAIILSILSSFLTIGIIRMLSLPKICSIKQQASVIGTSGIGAGAGVFTVFCTLCTIPVLSFFGLSLSLAVFTDYSIYFRIASMILLLFSIYMVEHYLAQHPSSK